MAYLYRLGPLVACCLAVLTPASVFAADPYMTVYTAQLAAGQTEWNTQKAASDGCKAAYNPNTCATVTGSVTIQTQGSSLRWYFTLTGPVNSGSPTWEDYGAWIPFGGSTFTCPSVGTEDREYTVPTSAGDPLGTRWLCGGQTDSTGQYACTLKVVPKTAYVGRATGTSDWFAVGIGVYTGGSCVLKAGQDGTSEANDSSANHAPKGATQPVEEAKPTPANCRPPKQFGTVNGVEVCLPAPTDTPVVSKSDKGTTTTSTDPTTGQPVTTTTDTNKTANCSGTTCTVTTTTTVTTVINNGTPTTKTETKTDTGVDRGTYCRQNPSDPACKGTSDTDDKGTFGGVCGAVPACTGDAVQCAIATAQFKDTCIAEKMSSPDGDPNSITNKALLGLDPGDVDKMKADAHAGAVGVGTISRNGRGWSRSCPADPVVELAWSGQQFTLPLSKVCSPLQLLANVAVLLTLLGSLLWVIGKEKS